MKNGLLLLLIIALAGFPLSAFSQNSELTSKQQLLLEQARDKGSIPVIINLNMNFRTPAVNEVELIEQQRAAILSTRESIFSRQSGMLIENLKIYDNIPHFALTTDSDGIIRLLNDPEVSDVVEDAISAPQMNISNSIIGSPEVWDVGITGEGITVAVLDTGVDSFHPHFGDRVIQEVCYSSNSVFYGASSLCPNQASFAVGSGVAADCDSSIQGCGHGTHVAGTVSGSSVNSGREINGVAKDASIIAMQVFSRFPQSECGPGAGTDCVLSFNSDQVAALDWLYSNRESFTLAAANMSLGGGRHFSDCDNDNIAIKNAMDLLKSANTATVVASANNGYKDSIASPACVSTAVSVGSTQTGKYGGTTLDAISGFSNSSEMLNLLAPGHFIESSRPDGAYAGLSGTSMAAPHVAGAWALYRQAFPNASVDVTLEAMQSTGVPLTDTNSIIKSRLQINHAMQIQATAVVTPAELSYSLESTDQGTAVLNISNAGESTLSFTISDIAESPEPSRADAARESRFNVPLDIYQLQTDSQDRVATQVFRQQPNTSYHTINSQSATGEELNQSCTNRTFPPDWNPEDPLTYFTLGADGAFFGLNSFEDIAYGQIFTISEPVSLTGAEYVLEKTGTGGTALFTVWDEATRAVLSQTPVPMADLPNGTNVVHVPFDNPVTVTNDIIIGVELTQLNSFVAGSYEFGNISSPEGSTSNPTALILGEGGWAHFGLFVELAIYGCTSSPDFTPTFSLNYNPVSGSVEPGSSTNVVVTVATDDLEPGIYTRTIIIITNDPENSSIEVPVTVTVGDQLTATLPGPNQGWRMLGSPVPNTTYGELFSTIWTQGYPGANTSNGTSNVYFYDEQTGVFSPPASADSFIGGSGTNFDDIALGTLIFVYEDDNFDQVPDGWPKFINVAGPAFTSPYSQPLPNTGPGDGWHLLSNPYPFGIDWDLVLADADGINANFQIWDPNHDGGPEYINPAPGGGHSGIIAPFQGFWVQSLDENAAIGFSPDHQAGSDGQLYSHPETPMAELILKGEGLTDSHHLLFDDEGSQTPLYYNVPILGSLSPNYLRLFSEGTDMKGWRTQFVAAEHSERLELPLQVQSTAAGTFILETGTFELPENLMLILKDNLNGQEFELTPDFQYSFELSQDDIMLHKNSSGELITDAISWLNQPDQFTSLKSLESRFTLIIDPDVATGTQEPEIVNTFTLQQNYPNPFNPTTQISYSIAESADVRLEVFNMLGQRVVVLVNEMQTPGSYAVRFDASDFSSGMYLYRLQAGTMILTRKMVLVK